MDNVNTLKAKPFGKNDASLYIIVDTPDETETRFGALGDGQRTRYIRTFLDSMKFNDYRIGSIADTVTHRTNEKGQQVISSPSAESIMNHLGDLAQDIYQTDPKVIMTFGNLSLKTILNDQASTLSRDHNLIKTAHLYDRDYDVVPAYSPLYVMQNSSDQDITSSFYRDLVKAIKMVKGEYVDVMDQIELSISTTYDEFKNFVDTNLQDDTVLVYDYETNAVDVHREDFHDVGFSMANKGNVADHKLRGTYVVLESLDYKMPEDDVKKVRQLVMDLVKNVSNRKTRTRNLKLDKYVSDLKEAHGGELPYKVGYESGRTIDGKILVHNSMYERPATLNIYDYEIPYDDLDDTLVMAKLLLGGKIGAGLKPQAQAIGYPDWETDLGNYIKLFVSMANGKGDLYDMIINNKWNEAYSVQYASSSLEILKKYLNKVQPVFDEFDLTKYSKIILSYPNITEDQADTLLKGLSDLTNPSRCDFSWFNRSMYLRTHNPEITKSTQFKGHEEECTNLIRSKYPDLYALSTEYHHHEIFNEMVDKKTDNAVKGKKNGKAPDLTILEVIIEFVNLVSSYYDDPVSLSNVLQLVSAKLIEFPDSEYSRIIPYSWVPIRLISKYGAMDSVATYDVEDNFLQRMVNESNEEVNLFKGYEVYLRQHFMGYVMEQNGLYWDDDEAQAIKDDMASQSVNAVKIMAKAKPMQFYLMNKFFDQYAPEIIYENNLNKYFMNNFGRKVTVRTVRGKDTYRMLEVSPKLDDEGNVIKLENGDIDYEDGKVIHIKYFFTGGSTKTINVEAVTDIDPRIKEYIQNKVLEKVLNEIESKNSVEELKPYINPSSSQGGDFESLKQAFSDSIITNNYKYARTIVNINDLIEAGVNKQDAVEGKELLDAVSEYMTYSSDYENKEDEEKQKYIRDNFVQLKRDHWPHVIELINQYFIQIGSPQSYEVPLDRRGEPIITDKLYDKVCAGLYAEYPGAKDGDTIYMYEAMKLFPMDLDDPDSWHDQYPEFEFMYNLRVFKKATKMISSYVEGTIGRQNVWSVDTDKLKRGDLRLPRKHKYYDLPADENGKAIVPEGESLILQSSFGVNTADTGRWRSGIHTIPAKSHIKRMYTSRYTGGTICMPDFAQNEVRALASSAHETSMQEAFASGADIHMENAKKIWGKEDITPDERRFAKTATFSILYGADVHSFANSYLAGDLKKAQEIYDNFFNAFPKIREWREARFKEAIETGRVATLTDRYISIPVHDKERDPYKFEEDMRHAGNYPIQGGSSDVAGCTMFAIDDSNRHSNSGDKFFVFVHDSLESDCPPQELIHQILLQQDILAHYAHDNFDMICKADMEVGYSFGHEITMEEIETVGDQENEAYMTLSGYKDEIMDTVNNWKKVYSVSEVIEEDYKPQYESTDMFFIPRHAISPWIRKMRYSGSAKVHIKY